MKLSLHRIALKPDYTIGKLYIDYEGGNGPEFFSDTLEPAVRTGPKIMGKTAIPYGLYKFIMAWSPKHKRDCPLLENVPNFEGVEIHIGNLPQDTEGCILVGNNREVGQVLNSTETFNSLYAKLIASHQNEWYLNIT